MNVNERYEFMAERYYKETGKLAQGKDSPCGFGMTDAEKDQNRKEWGQWCERFMSELFARNFNIDNSY